ncbi:MAG: lipid A deacylase LpxR family protein [Pseudomonadota bacterium]
MTVMVRSFVVMTALACFGTAAAQPNLDDPDATWTLLVENDSFTREDDNYTSGASIGYVSGTRELSGFSQFLSDTFVRPKGAAVTRRGFTLTHAFYTPDNLRPTEFQPGEHPYAGLFTAEATWMVQQRHRIDRFSVEFGFVGDSALAEDIQKATHDITGDVDPQGWDTQVDDEVLLNLHYNVQKRFLRSRAFLGVPVDLIVGGVASAGNKYTGIGGSTTLRWGPGIDSTFSTHRVRTALNGGSGFFTARNDGKFQWYLFGGGDVRAVAHNIVLDDSFFREDDFIDVQSSVWVADFEIGAVLQRGKYQGAVTVVARSPQFDEENETQTFAAISLSRKF